MTGCDDPTPHHPGDQDFGSRGEQHTGDVGGLRAGSSIATRLIEPRKPEKTGQSTLVYWSGDLF
jgi:hypothetical protein